jgi:azurin/DNA-binding transcriptional ArsR family regulator
MSLAMPRRLRIGMLACAVVVPAVAMAQAPPPPTVLYDVSPRAVDYQLSRLSNAELSRVERSSGDAKYRPVYLAILIRAGMPRGDFDDALTALATIDKASRTRVLLDALAKVPATEEAPAGRLIGALVAQPAATLAADRAALETAVGAAGSSPFVLRGAYGGLLVADGIADRAWTTATAHEGHLPQLIESIAFLPTGAAASASLVPRLATVAAQPPDAATRVAALAALAHVRPDAESFQQIVAALPEVSDEAGRETLLQALQRIPQSAWPPAQVEPAARTVVALVRDLPPEKRTAGAGLEAVQAGTALAAAVPGDSGRELRRTVRDLGVQIVRIATVPEEMRYDLKWFAVEAGKPVQIVLTNPDTMQHNLVVGQPKSVREIGTMAATMAPPTDASTRAYVPDSPLVMRATRLLNWGETARLDLVAPKDPGEYIYVCTFPGHWVRMYGVMLVVPDLEAWEATRRPPTDPLTGQPYTSQR